MNYNELYDAMGNLYDIAMEGIFQKRKTLKDQQVRDSVYTALNDGKLYRAITKAESSNLVNKYSSKILNVVKRVAPKYFKDYTIIGKKDVDSILLFTSYDNDDDHARDVMEIMKHQIVTNIPELREYGFDIRNRTAAFRNYGDFSDKYYQQFILIFDGVRIKSMDELNSLESDIKIYSDNGDYVYAFYKRDDGSFAKYGLINAEYKD